MAILSFKKRFAGKVRNGSKRQTIRAFRKYPIQPGETLYLYTALRTKFAKRLRVVKCKSVDQIGIFYNTNRIMIYPSDSKPIELRSIHDLNEFAKSDGFQDWADMRSFWIENHSGHFPGVFSGNIIKW